MLELTFAALAFTGSHMILSHGAIRKGLIARLGRWPFRLVYSLIALATFVWLMQAYGAAPRDDLFEAHIALKHMPLTLMAFASFFIISGYTIANPSAIVLEDLDGGDAISGILKVTRAPVMWGVALFAVSHMLANVDPASWIFFGALMVLALAGGWHLDQRKKAEGEEKWQKLQAETSFIPFAALLCGRTTLEIRELGWWRIALALALYGVLMVAHGMLIGVSSMPMPD